jgi:DNA repair exonuclease SbcCD nuclease subunit
MFRPLIIGDPHFRDNNTIDTDMMASQIVSLVLSQKPDIVVILGDISDNFNNVTIGTIHRFNRFLASLQQITSHLYIMVGNHDRRNNFIYMTDEHPFGAMKMWNRTTVVDTTTVASHSDSEGIERKIVLVPYVPKGRLNEALQVKEMGIETVDSKEGLGGVMFVCTHQEYKDMKMGVAKSTSADEWPLRAPPCFNGHIHDRDVHQPNLFNIGAPIQLGYTDSRGRTVSLFTFENGFLKDEQRFDLGLPAKIQITMTPQELMSGYTPPPGAQVRIIVHGPISVINAAMEVESVKNLSKMAGIKIIPKGTADTQTKELKELKIKTNVDFQTRLVDTMSQQSSKMRLLFTKITGIDLHEDKVANKTLLVIS